MHVTHGPYILVLFLVLLFPSVPNAKTHALLIGVSGYPSLPQADRLIGPANDVRLIRAALLRQGVRSSSIRILADGVSGSIGLPTRREILAALADLEFRAEAGDWVIVYFSGHGSQQKQLSNHPSYVEPDGLDEIFLPYDIGRWDGSQMVVENAISDDEIGLAIDALRRKNIRVWAIFDTCHAGDMAKSLSLQPEQPLFRYIHPKVLGVPSEFSGGDAVVTPKSLDSHTSRTPRSIALSRQPKQIPQPGLVIFYASQPEEPAAEELLPNPILQGSRNAMAAKLYFGYFTYLIAKSMPGWRGSFRQLAEKISQYYDRRPYPTPSFEGSLDESLTMAP